MENKILKVGETVLWSGSWGTDAPVTAVVTNIERDCVGKEGKSCDQVDWDEVDGRSVIVDLDNGSWAYGFQIKPVPVRPKRGEIVKLPTRNS